MSRRRALLLAFAGLAGTTSTGCSSQPFEASNPERNGTEGAASAASLETVQVLSQVRISSNPDAEHHQQAEADVDFGHDQVTRATLRVKLQSPIEEPALAQPGLHTAQRSIPALREGGNWLGSLS